MVHREIATALHITPPAFTITHCSLTVTHTPTSLRTSHSPPNSQYNKKYSTITSYIQHKQCTVHTVDCYKSSLIPAHIDAHLFSHMHANTKTCTVCGELCIINHLELHSSPICSFAFPSIQKNVYASTAPSHRSS